MTDQSPHPLEADELGAVVDFVELGALDVGFTGVLEVVECAGLDVELVELGALDVGFALLGEVEADFEVVSA